MPKKPSSALRKSRNAGSLRRAEFLALLLPLLFCACAGYRLGPTNGAPARSKAVQVNLFQNATTEPRLTEPLATALRRTIQQDGTYRLATRGNADVILEGAITEFDRSGVTFDPRDILTVRDYELRMTATFTVKEIATGQVLLSSTEFGRTTIRAGSDLPSAERQAAPLLAQDLAQRITAALVDGSW
jgi:hypothetical protein